MFRAEKSTLRPSQTVVATSTQFSSYMANSRTRLLIASLLDWRKRSVIIIGSVPIEYLISQNNGEVVQAIRSGFVSNLSGIDIVLGKLAE